MFKIIMIAVDGSSANMPGDRDLGFVDACDRARTYKHRDPDRRFCVVNSRTSEIEYEA